MTAHNTPSQMDDINSGLPQSAAFLAYAGSLLPIIAAIFIWLRPDDLGEGAKTFLLLYGGALIAFFGGVRWGIAVMRPGGPTFAHLIGGIWPLLVAMPVFLLDDNLVRFLIIVISLPVLLIDDLRATRAGSGAPQWYLGVRVPLTIIMEVAFIAAAISIVINRGGLF